MMQNMMYNPGMQQMQQQQGMPQLTTAPQMPQQGGNNKYSFNHLKDLDLVGHPCLVVALCHNHLCSAVEALAADLDLNHPCLVAEDMVVASADLLCLEAVDSAATSVAVVDSVDPQCLAVAVLAEALEDLLCMAEASEEVSAVVDLPSSAVDFQAWAEDLEAASQVWAAVWVEALEAIHSVINSAVDVVDSAAIHFKVAA